MREKLCMPLLLLLDGCTAAAAGDFLSIVSEFQSFEVHLSSVEQRDRERKLFSRRRRSCSALLVMRNGWNGGALYHLPGWSSSLQWDAPPPGLWSSSQMYHHVGGGGAPAPTPVMGWPEAGPSLWVAANPWEGWGAPFQQAGMRPPPFPPPPVLRDGGWRGHVQQNGHIISSGESCPASYPHPDVNAGAAKVSNPPPAAAIRSSLSPQFSASAAQETSRGIPGSGLTGNRSSRQEVADEAAKRAQETSHIALGSGLTGNRSSQQEVADEAVKCAQGTSRCAPGSRVTGNRSSQLEVADEAAKQAYGESLAEGKHISVFKVCQGTLSALGVSAFELLGFRMQEVPCLRNLALIEGKVNAFIHCHVAGKRITTLYDLGCDLIQEEGVSDFEDLGLGPLLCHPLVIRYFSPPVKGDVLTITTEEVIQHLADYLGEPGCGTHVDINKFMVYLQKERKAPTPEHLGVRVQSLGLHLAALVRAKKAEADLIKTWKGLPCTQFELTHTSSVVARVAQFLSSEKQQTKALAGHLKRKREALSDSSDDETGSSGKKVAAVKEGTRAAAWMQEIVEKLSGASKGKAIGHFSNCPYPSAAEEKFRVKRQRKLEAELERESPEACHLTSKEVAEFIMVLKDICSDRTVVQVLEQLLDNRHASALKSMNKDQKKLFKAKKNKQMQLFRDYPGLGLLYVAVMSVKVGLWDNMYDASEEDTKEEKIAVSEACPVFIDHTPDPRLALDVTKGLSDGSTGGLLEPKPCLNTAVPFHRVQAFVHQAIFASEAVELPSHDELAALVFQQFKVRGIEEVLNGSFWDSLVKQCREMCPLTASNRHISFLGALVPISGQSECLENQRFENSGVPTKVGVLGIKSIPDALQCLKNAPVLADLSLWSQWNTVFAPTLGPLLDFLECEGTASGIHAMVTCNGAILKVNAAASVDGFLAAAIRGHELMLAAELVSLVAIHGGVAHTPSALLKLHTVKALNVQLTSLLGESLGDRCYDKRSGALCETEVRIRTKLINRNHPQNGSAVSTSLETSEILLPSSSERYHASAINAVALFVLKVLCAIPIELRVFAAEIFLGALSTVVSDAASIMLGACQSPEHFRLLHGVGLSLGVPEWIAHYNSYVLLPGNRGKLCDDEFEVLSSQTDICTAAAAPEKGQGNCEVCSGMQMEHMVTGHETGVQRTVDVESDGLLESSVPIKLPPAACPLSELQGEEIGEQSVVQAEDPSLDLHAGTEFGRSEFIEDLMHESRASGTDGCRDEASEIVEAIRRDEFGVGQELASREQELLARQHARMGRALHRLSQDLYSQDSHFVLELVQNADDNSYMAGVEATLVFLVKHGHIVVLNNEQGFTSDNLRALCDVGNSTKAGNNTGYIGNKGIGFKSVFRVTDSPEIHSNGFHVKFDITESDLGFILPTIIPPCHDWDSYGTLLRLIEQRRGWSGAKPARWSTRIDLPIKASIREGAGMDFLASKFEDIHPSLLLFLHRLQCIAVHNDLTGSTQVMYREDLVNGLVRVAHDGQQVTWLVVRHQLQAAVFRPGITVTEIALAFTLRQLSSMLYEASPEQQQVFAFLPLRAYGLRFIVQGDFILPSSREEVDRDSAWNQWLRSEIPEAFMKASEMFKSLPSLGSPGRAASQFMQYVPLEGEVLGFFSPLPRIIHARLRGTQCLPVEGLEEWTFPCVLVQGWNDAVRKLIPDTILKEHLGLQYLNKEVQLSDSLASSLGVQKYGVHMLVALMKSLCQKKGAVESLGLEWVGTWLIALHDSLLVKQQTTHIMSQQDKEASLLGDLQSLQFIPLVDGSFSSLTDGTIWFSSHRIENRFVTDDSLSCYPLIFAELRTADPLLFMNEHEVEGSTVLKAGRGSSKGINFVNSGKVRRVLQQLGVMPMSAHEVVRNHVLPAMAEANCLGRDTHLVVQYLAYVKWHLQSGCSKCVNDRIYMQLKENAAILTSNGLCRLNKGSIHFGLAMGNPLDVQSILEGTSVEWNEVDTSYLQLSSPHDMTSDVGSWRKFLSGLGVMDFVKVVPVERQVSDKAASLWQNVIWQGDGWAQGGWIVQDWESPELIDIVTAVCSFVDVVVKEKGKKASGKAEKCASLLLALDKLWSTKFSSSWRAKYRRLEDTKDAWRGETEASWVMQVQNLKWVMSSLDGQLHTPTALFQQCEAVERFLGSHAPYAIPQIQSMEFMRALGLRTQVTVNDCISLLHHLGDRKQPFEASVAQMARLYSFLAERMSTDRDVVLATLKLYPSIFVPLKWGNAREQVLHGSFYSVGDVCWNDPTAALNTLVSITEKAQKAGSKEISPSVDSGSEQHVRVKVLSSFYPELKSFFVRDCQVQERPNFSAYIKVLRGLAAAAPPTLAFDQVMEVYAALSWEIECGRVTETDVQQWKSQLQDPDCAVLPTTQNKWVSLNDHVGVVCVCDDTKIAEEFPDAAVEGLHFLQLNDSYFHERAKARRTKPAARQTVQPLLEALGIPLLSQIVEREVISYGSQDACRIEARISWALPYAQRYMLQHHNEHYNSLENLHFAEEVKKLQCVVVDQLYFRYTLQSGRHCSRCRLECGALLQTKQGKWDLQGSTLHVAAAQAEDHCMVYAELSRFFFSGQPNLQLANFLHMITLMASLGSSETVVESNVVNIQGVQPLPAGMVPWALDVSIQNDIPSDVTTSGISAAMASAEVYIQRHAKKLEETMPRKTKVSHSYSGWPPQSWIPLPTIKSTAALSIKKGELGDTLSSVVERNKAPAKFVPDDRQTETTKSLLKGPTDCSTGDGTQDISTKANISLNGAEFHSKSQDLKLGLAAQCTVEEVPPNANITNSTNTQMPDILVKKQLVLDPQSEQRQMTGRAGEALVSQYLAGKHGPAHVKWVNEDGETGAAFDIIVTTETGRQEFVEVKATRSQDKDWFEISNREWEFGQVHGDQFTIIRVFLAGPEQPARILRIPNPVMLCQKRILQLAVVLPHNSLQGMPPSEEMQIASYSVNLSEIAAD